MNFPDEIKAILEDRESGSIALLNRLISALELTLREGGFSQEGLLGLIARIRPELRHFAAMENFLVEFRDVLQGPGGNREAGRAFITSYREHWKDSEEKTTEHFLQSCAPQGKTFLTHSHSHSILSLIAQLQNRHLHFQVVQTLSAPGEEGKIALEKIVKLGVRASLIRDDELDEVIPGVDVVLMGCDALLPGEFLNKVGTGKILEKAKETGIPAYVLAETRKQIEDDGWKGHLPPHPRFEWVPLSLVRAVVTEEGSRSEVDRL